MLSEREYVNEITIMSDGKIQVRIAKEVVRDEGTENEKVIAKEYWRGVIENGDTARAVELLGDKSIIATTAWQTLTA